MKLTKRSIEAARYQGGTDYRWDDSLPGFGLRLYPSGKKSFVVGYRVRGRKRIMVLGMYGPMTPDQARSRARKILVEATDGRDASQDRQQALKAPTVRDLAKRYLEEHARPQKKPKSIEEDERQWRLHVLPVLRSRKVADVTSEDILRLQRRLAQTPYRANRVVALLSKAFNLAEAWKWRPAHSNPCLHVEKFKEKPRQKYLSQAELERLSATLAEAQERGTEAPAAIAAIRLLLFTGCRLREILRLRWSEVDLDGTCLHLPDSKTGSKTVVLNDVALEILSGVEPVEGNPYVIVGAKPGTHLVNLTSTWYRLRERARLNDVRLHDLRHTFASFGVAAGLSLPQIGQLLGHKHAATTQRYTHLITDPARKASAAVGDSLAQAMTGGGSRSG